MGLPRKKRIAAILIITISALYICSIFMIPCIVQSEGSCISCKTEEFRISPIRNVEVIVMKDNPVIVSGAPIGIKMQSKGVLVTGYIGFLSSENIYVTPARDSGFKIGDRIVEMDGKKINSCDELIRNVEKSKSSTHTFMVDRNSCMIKITAKSGTDGQTGKKRMGLWIKDSAAGIGTLTFYDRKTGFFGALGHGITDSETSNIFAISGGELLPASIFDISKGVPGCPGELKGYFTSVTDALGKVMVNSPTGVFGVISKNRYHDIYGKEVYIGTSSQVRVGKATILTTLGEGEPKEYEIEITKINKNKVTSPKGLVIKITDETLLEKTGGIVQGMSGSPILQDGLLIGAVTHVMVNDPTTGYGVFIEGMLANRDLVFKSDKTFTELDLAS